MSDDALTGKAPQALHSGKAAIRGPRSREGDRDQPLCLTLPVLSEVHLRCGPSLAPMMRVLRESGFSCLDSEVRSRKLERVSRTVSVAPMGGHQKLS